MAGTDTPTPRAAKAPGRSRAAHWWAEPNGKAALILTAAAATVIALVAAGWPPLLRADHRLASRLHVLALEHPACTHANRILTDWIWDPWTMRALLTVGVIVLWRHGRRLLALWIAATSAVESGIRSVLRWAVGRDRPVWEHPVDSASFNAMPSGHAMTAAASCVLLLWLARRAGLRAGLWCLAVAVAAVSVAGVCFTRMFLGVHWPTDTLAGALLGAALATASIATWNTAEHGRQRVGPGGGQR
ncbi:phosphatase PAP2 family protein (plasmid) [Streptomyces mirabilis]|uniref:phosphatase PAP2 family protein n=1 Tax=Streptomyces mirabilis TaxID=68239 RepID=UPI001BAF4DD2|nr:phosphatase PAP2 family protein [Streptomyces mirabilis]QUW85705.1 phosphatase PAP2 family protein [Streptomyces mirabilis]